MNIENKQEQIEIIRIILNSFFKRELSFKEAEILWSLWKMGDDDPVLSTYLICKKIYDSK